MPLDHTILMVSAHYTIRDLLITIFNLFLECILGKDPIVSMIRLYVDPITSCIRFESFFVASVGGLSTLVCMWE